MTTNPETVDRMLNRADPSGPYLKVSAQAPPTLPYYYAAMYEPQDDDEHGCVGDESAPGSPQPSVNAVFSRRAIIGGVSAAAVLGAGSMVVGHLESQAPSGELVSKGLLAPALMTSKRFTVAHHGGSANWPEMSMVAYHNAVALGVNALEISLARTSDGVWFGLHDKTLDRTSNISGFVASEHTWAEVRQHEIQPPATARPGVRPQPYMRAVDLFNTYGSSHAIFVDPKTVPTEYYSELLSIMESSVHHLSNTFVAKGYCTGVAWARTAHRHGIRTWGYYYAKDIAEQPRLLLQTSDPWGMLGLNYAGPRSIWDEMRALGKPVIGHVIPTEQAARTAWSKGADGLMISGILEVLT